LLISIAQLPPEFKHNKDRKNSISPVSNRRRRFSHGLHTSNFDA